jgi:hypothetical protein
MRGVALSLLLLLGSAQAGPILQTAPDPAQSRPIMPTGPIVSPLATRNSMKTISVMKLRNLSLLGEDFAASSLSQWLVSPEESLGILRVQSSNPADFALDRAFFAQIGLDPVSVARRLGMGDELTSLDHQPSTTETYVEAMVPDSASIEDLKDLKEMQKDQFKYSEADFFKIKESFSQYFPPGPIIPPEEPVPWLQHLLSRIHQNSQELLIFVVDNIYKFIFINLLALVMIQFYLRRNR